MKRHQALNIDATRMSSPMSKSNLSSTSTSSDTEYSAEKLTEVDTSIRLPKTWIREIFLVIILISSQLVTLIGAVQGVPIAAYLRERYRIEPAKGGLVGWANASYMLGSAVMVLIAGKLGDLNGHKRMVVFGWIWLTIWSLITGFSYYDRGNQAFYYTARALQGIGSGFIVPNSLAIMGRTYFEPGLKKTIIFSIFGMMTSTGFVIGTTFSSLFAQLTKWAWNYWALACVCVLYTVGAILFIPPDNIVHKPNSKPLYKRFDYLGAITGVSGLVLFDVAFTQASALGWSPPHTYITLIIGVILILIAMFVDWRVDDPLVPLQHLRADVVVILICVYFGFLSFVIWANWFWQFYELVHNDSPLRIAAKLVPLAIGSIPAAIFTVTCLQLNIKAPTMMVISMVCFLVPNILMATVTPNTTYWAQPFVSSIIAPFAVDITVPTATLLFSDSVRKESQGIAASLIITVISYAISIGPSYTAMVMWYVAPLGNDSTPGGFTHSLHSNFICGIVLSGIGLVTAVIAGLIDYKITRTHCGDIPPPLSKIGRKSKK